jgi:hypothetical protein
VNVIKVLAITIGVFMLAVFAAPFVLGVTAVAILTGSAAGQRAIAASHASHKMNDQAAEDTMAGVAERTRETHQAAERRAEAAQEAFRESYSRELAAQRAAAYKPGEPMSSAEPTR